MRVRRHKRWLFVVATALLVATVCVVCLCRHYRVYSVGGWQVYQAMELECHPAWRDYHFGQVKAGDPVEDVIERTQPVAIERRDRRVFLTYKRSGLGIAFTTMTAVAHDGRMVLAYASSCSWVRLFFDELSEEQSLELLGTPKDDPRRLGIVPVYR